jgi:hypothetical protein
MRYYQHQYKHAKHIPVSYILTFMLTLATTCHWYFWQHRHRKLAELIRQAPQVVVRMRAKCKGDLINGRLAKGELKPEPTRNEIEARMKSFSALLRFQGSYG